ncbi:MAG: hypothetical protein FWG98_08255 [Candidatus Cloacimonetes bacterium]|nr:hypothetical protein [Candidatus Cloacimonadota bacterium]
MARIRMFRDLVESKSGLSTQRELIFVTPGNKNFSYTRRLPRTRRKTDHQTLIGNKMKAASALWKSLSEGFKNDLKRYAQLYNVQQQSDDKQDIGQYNVWVMALCKHSSAIYDLDTLGSIYGNTLSAWISAGALKPVSSTVPFSAQLNP